MVRALVAVAGTGSLLRLASMVAMVGSTHVLVEQLEPSGFGLYATYSSLVLLATVMDGGLGSVGLTWLPRAGSSQQASDVVTQVFSGTFKISSGASCFAVGVSGATLVFAPQYWGPVTAVACTLAVSSPVTATAKMAFGLRKPLAASTWLAVQSGLPIVFAAGVVSLWDGTGWTGALYSHLAAYLVVGYAQTCAMFRPVRATRTWASAVPFSDAIPFAALSLIAVLAFQLDVVVVSIVLGPEAAAEVSVAIRAFGTPGILLQAAYSHLWARLSSSVDIRSTVPWRTLAPALLLSTTVVGAVLTMMAIFSDLIFTSWVGREAVPSPALVAACLSWFTWQAFWTPISVSLNAMEHQRRQLRYAAFMVLANVPLSFVLTLHWGTSGPVWASLMTHAALNVAMLLGMRREGLA